MKTFSQKKEGLEIDLFPVERGDHSGDCIALRYGNLYDGCQHQTVFVIDGGYSDNKDTLKKHLKSYYNCFYDRKYHIDVLFLSHPDQDHVQGLVKILEDTEIEVDAIVAMIPWRVMTPAWYKDKRITPNSLEARLESAFKELSKLEEIAEERGIEIIMPTDMYQRCELNGCTITTLGPSLKFYKECIANCPKTPDPDDRVRRMSASAICDNNDREEKYIPGHIHWNYDETTSAINESSHIFILEFDHHKILFCGDAGKEALLKAIKEASEIGIDLTSIDIIKMPHHGSRKNVTPEIMDEFVGHHSHCYISCKKDDEGHHPSKRLVNMLNEKGFKVYFTQGSTLHKGFNAPNRDWKSVSPKDSYPTMEKV